MKSRKEKTVNYLLTLGNIEIESTSKKYRKFKPKIFQENYYFVGKNGALRYGVNIKSSISLTSYLERSKIL